ncbi:MAG TPA: lipid-A-disaccharide synthase, partial [Opitutales bacterium]|nr:lipid-A-disaccharide synthase [Opitutales bacterium]
MNLPPPTLAPWLDGTAPPDVLVVAGERSGDEHAARLIRELRARRPELRVAALGGPALQGAGAHLLYDLTAHAVVGLVEVLKNYGFFKELFAQTLAWIDKYQPRAVLLVDYPGFNLRLAKALFQRGRSRRAGGPLRVLYYISPQIWAWKSGRRFTMARHLDALAVIFPFEPACFADTKLPVEFVGHPFAAADHRLTVRYDVNGPVLMLPGSRVAAVSRIFPLMLAAFSRYRQSRPQARAVTLVSGPGVRAELEQELAKRPDLAPHITLRTAEEGAAGRVVLTSSGTMSLSCALAGIPGAIVYRANPITYLVGRAVVSVPYLGIANLLLGRDAWPEFIQGDAKPVALARRLMECEA